MMERLGKALAAYVGKGRSSYPKEDMGAVIERFGEEDGAPLAREAQRIVGELRKVQPDWSDGSLIEVARAAVARFKKTHPDLDDDATAALVWIYSWWWK